MVRSGLDGLVMVLAWVSEGNGSEVHVSLSCIGQENFRICAAVFTWVYDVLWV